MKKKNICRTRGTSARLAGTVLIMSIAVQASGCAASELREADQPNEITQSKIEENTESEANIEETGKEYVYDFDALVNDKWKETAKAKAEENGYDSYSHVTEESRLIDERVLSIFDTDISSLSEDSDLYKFLYVYNQIRDAKWQDGSAKHAIKEKLDLIDSIETRDALYALFTEKFWGQFNFGMYRVVDFNMGDVINNIAPMTVNQKERMSDEQKSAIQRYLEQLGYDEDRTSQMVENADEMDVIISSYLEKLSEDTYFGFIDSKILEEKNVEFPIFDILSKQNALGKDKMFYSRMDYIDFLSEYYTEKNISKIRDHLLVSAAVSLSRLDKEDEGITFNTVYPDVTPADFEICLRNAMFGPGKNIIEKTYKDQYIDDETIKSMETILEDVKTTMRTVIADSDWLSVHGKEQAGHKIFYLKNYIGENGHTDDFSEVELAENPLENYIALKVSMYDFLDKQLVNDKTDKEMFSASFLVDNAFYFSQNNSIVIGDGYLENKLDDDSYEEKLAYWGCMLAHELSHAYDPKGSNYDYEGYYDKWMSDEEYAEYTKRTQKIEDFFDGKEVGDGITLDGKRVCGETFSDIMGIECCLRILENMENPDYDAFFKTYAKVYTCYYTQDGLKKAVEDTHLPGKERVNYVLGQFDKFYEIYDVDTTSPYYVSEEDRLSAF
ncbi:M13-type metalloendopeptidase [Butyrivibrio sp. AE3004]|uniref:M13-type metalloendopeptidase n=1 Tax=Butyrivibrio sp. AE3004 TaxID=1506994 RepID=UPI00049445E1|nr:M13-type metalloendopeptidase [Butyrivibrio sp. AE3004]